MAERRAELAERSREDQELAARVEAEVARRLAEAAQSEEVAQRIQRKLIVRAGRLPTYSISRLWAVRSRCDGLRRGRHS